MKIIAVGLILLSFAFPAEGSLFLSPIGHREAFLGNAGAGLAGSPGAVIYNPAGIAFTDSPSVSLSGSAVTYQEFSEKDFERTTGELKSQSLLTSANFMGNEDIRVSLYYAFPGNIQDYGRTDTLDTTAQVIKNFETERELALGGIVYAGLFDSKRAWGIGMNVAYRELNGTLYQEVIEAATSEVQVEKRREQLMSFVLTPGFTWRVNPYYDLGITVQWKALDLYATGDLYQSSLATGDPRPTESSSGYTPHSDDLLGITFGQVFFWNSQRLLVDISYAPYSGIRLAQEGDVAPLKNISLGWEVPVRAHAQLMSGASYSELSDFHFLILTTGLAFQPVKSYDGNIGLFLKVAENKHQESADSLTWGFLYSSSLDY